jgi:hypothetical protein
MGYLGLLINMTTSRVVCSDLNAITNLLTVATMLFEGEGPQPSNDLVHCRNVKLCIPSLELFIFSQGLALECVKPAEKDAKGSAVPQRKWEALNHPQVQ